jgi:cytochrome P450
MHETIKALFEQFWERKDEIMVGTLFENFILSLAINLFMSIKEGPEFHALTHDMNTYLVGFLVVPLNLPRTTYDKARLAHKKMFHTLDIMIYQKHKASDFVLQVFFCCICNNLSLFPKYLIPFTICCLD